MFPIKKISVVLFACSLSLLGQLADIQLVQARIPLRNICRVKGQEENILRGLGLVVGLNGTGEVNDPSTMRALARSMEIMGSPVTQQGLPGSASFDELKKVKNAALVWVTVRVPATGARRGDKLNCSVSAINGKSLEGGNLVFAALQGPSTTDHRVYALAEGRIHLDSPEIPTSGRVHGGCVMQEDVFTPFEKDGYVTLVIEENHADFQTAADIVSIIHQTHFKEDEAREDVRAVNAANIVVKIPDTYRDDPVGFISNLLEIDVYQAEPEARVVINERTGSIVVSGEVQIGDVVVSHRNIVVDANETATPFAGVTQTEEGNLKLQALINALDALNVPNEDAIEIIKSIERNGKLHGRLIIE